MPWDQLLILITGPAAIGLSQVERTKRWACIVGLSGQCGWFHATWIAEQWGMFAASFVYAGMWCIGLWTHWAKPLWQLCSELDTAAIHLEGLGGGPAYRSRQKKPKLRLVPRDKD